MKRIRLVLCILPLLILLTGCGAKEIAAPENAKAAWSADYAISVSWDESEEAEIYRVFRKDKDQQDFRFITDTKKTVFTDYTAKKGMEYRYKVMALSDEGKSQGTATDECILPVKTRLISIEIDRDGSVDLSWENDGAKLYKIYGEKDAESGRVYLAETADTQIHFEEKGVFRNYYVVSVYEKYGVTLESDFSEPLHVIDLPRVRAVSRMDKHTNVIEIDCDEDRPVSFRVYRGLSRYDTFEFLGETDEKTFYDETAQKNVKYYYMVQAVSAHAMSERTLAMHEGYRQKEIAGVPVFMYHEFVTQEDLDSGVAFDEYAIWRHEFEEDLIWIRDNGYTTITTEDLVNWLDGNGTLPEKPIILTIDDGKLGVYKNAYPLLKEYNMKAVLALIGAEIDAATMYPEDRAKSIAPYCTWEEIGEMSDTGHVEMISHTYGLHVFYHDQGRRGANVAEGETSVHLYPSAIGDYRQIQNLLTEATGKGCVALAYPYSSRSRESDIAWMKCGYRILLSGDSKDDRASEINYFVRDAGLNMNSSVLRRIARMTGTPLSAYMADMIASAL